jgi:hypothetical protein
MNPEVTPENIEVIGDVLNDIDDQIGDILNQVSERFQMRRSDVVKLALVDLLKRLQLEDERKMLIAVPIDDVEFFESPLEAFFRDSDEKYLEYYEILRGRQSGEH